LQAERPTSREKGKNRAGLSDKGHKKFTICGFCFYFRVVTLPDMHIEKINRGLYGDAKGKGRKKFKNNFIQRA
jgi:hypothetical protein